MGRRMKILRSDRETLKELLRINDSRSATVLFFTVRRDNIRGSVVGAHGKLVKSSESYFEALAKTPKYLQAHWIISGLGSAIGMETITIVIVVY